MQSIHTGKADEQKTARREKSKLTERYGKIGIPAVAAAVHCRAKERKEDRARSVTHVATD